MRSVSVSSCRCCMFVSCVHHVTVLHDFQFVNAGIEEQVTIWKRHTPEPVS